MLELAKMVAFTYHKDQKYGDKPYIYHLDNVYELVNTYCSNRCNYKNCLVIAWLHDILEDTHISACELRILFGNYIATTVEVLSKYVDGIGNGLTTEEHFGIISQDYCASLVKMCDRLTNVQHARFNGSKQFDRYVEEQVIIKDVFLNCKWEEVNILIKLIDTNLDLKSQKSL